MLVARQWGLKNTAVLLLKREYATEAMTKIIHVVRENLRLTLFSRRPPELGE
jgi:hypothetical protein